MPNRPTACRIETRPNQIATKGTAASQSPKVSNQSCSTAHRRHLLPRDRGDGTPSKSASVLRPGNVQYIRRRRQPDIHHLLTRECLSYPCRTYERGTELALCR
jgi:hypothetical protein